MKNRWRIYHLTFSIYHYSYEIFRFLSAAFYLFNRFGVSPGSRAGFGFKQTGFDKRHSADESADAAVKTFDENELDEF